LQPCYNVGHEYWPRKIPTVNRVNVDSRRPEE
jgi:hypothetical protein